MKALLLSLILASSACAADFDMEQILSKYVAADLDQKREELLKQFDSLAPEQRKKAIPILLHHLGDGQTMFAAEPFLVKLGKDAVPVLVESLKSDLPLLVEGATQVLATIGPDAVEAVPTLTALLQTPPAIKDPKASAAYRAYQELSYRGNYARALSGIGEKGLPVLLTSLKSDSEGIRVAATAALVAQTRIEKPAERLVPLLIDALAHDTPNVKLAAVNALKTFGPAAKAAIPELIKAKESTDKRLREAVPLALREIQIESKP